MELRFLSIPTGGNEYAKREHPKLEHHRSFLDQASTGRRDIHYGADRLREESIGGRGCETVERGDSLGRFDGRVPWDGHWYGKTQRG